MKTYISPQKGKTKKKFKDPKALKRLLQPFFLSCSDLCPQIKGHPGVFIVDAVKKLGEMRYSMAVVGGRPCGEETAKMLSRELKEDLIH